MQKHRSFAILAALLLAGISCSKFSPQIENEESDPPSVTWAKSQYLDSCAVGHVDGVEIIFGCYLNTFYIQQNTDDYSSGMLSREPFPFVYKRNGEYVKPESGYIDVNGTPVKVQYASTNPNVFAVNERGSGRPLREGKTTIQAKVKDTVVGFEIQIVQLPLRTAGYGYDELGGAKPEEIMRMFGVPDETSVHYITHSDSKTIDGLFYTASSKRSYQVTHWKYKKYPGLVLTFLQPTTSGLHAVKSTKPEDAHFRGIVNQ